MAACSIWPCLLVYSLALKHAVILDVLTIAAGFVVRAVAGAVAISVPISSWLLVCTTLLALFLALSKRRHELTLLGDAATWHRPSLQEYSPYLLDQMISVVTASTLIAYSVYATSPETAARLGTNRLALTIPFVLYGIFRYLYLVHQKSGGRQPHDAAAQRPAAAGMRRDVGARRGAAPLLAARAIAVAVMPVTIDAPAAPTARPEPRTARVAVVRTTPRSVIDDYARVMDLAGWRDAIAPTRDTLIKLNLSWTKYFPVLLVAAVAGRRRPVEDARRRLSRAQRLIPVENKTVVTDPRAGCRNNRWESVLSRHGLAFTALPEVEWQVYPFKSPLLKLNEIFPEGIQIPAIYPGPPDRAPAHREDPRSRRDDRLGQELLRRTAEGSPALRAQVHARGARGPALHAARAAPGRLHGHGRHGRGRRRRAAHDDPADQEPAARRLRFGRHRRHRGAADGIRSAVDPVPPDGARARALASRTLATSSSSATTSAARTSASRRGSRSSSGATRLIRKGFLRPLERVLLHSPLVVWAPMASNIYHDLMWYPTIGRSRIRAFMRTEWGQAFRE